METIKAKRSVALDRKIECYPPPKYHTLFRGYVEMNEMKNSEAVSEIMRQFFDNMPANKRTQCMNAGIRVTRSKHHY